MAKETIKFAVAPGLASWNEYEAGEHEVSADAKLQTLLAAGEAAGSIEIMEGNAKSGVESDDESLDAQADLTDEQVTLNKAVGNLEATRNSVMRELLVEATARRQEAEAAETEGDLDAADDLHDQADALEHRAYEAGNAASERLTEAVEEVAGDPEAARRFANEQRGERMARRRITPPEEAE